LDFISALPVRLETLRGLDLKIVKRGENPRKVVATPALAERPKRSADASVGMPAHGGNAHLRSQMWTVKALAWRMMVGWLWCPLEKASPV
jgi:hypothetical protein